jgi:hypothetical protein
VTEQHKKTEGLALGDITMKKPTWLTYSPTSAQVLLAEFAVMSALASAPSWEQVDDLWHVSLFPQKQVVKHVPSGKIMMSLRVEPDLAALVWPLEQVGEYFLFFEVTALKWALVIDFEAWQVIPTESHSPLHMRVQGGPKPPCPYGVRLHQAGAGSGIVDWHLERGFACLSEKVLKDLLEHFGLSAEALTGSIPGCKPTLVMAVALLRHLRPNLDVQAAINLLMTKRQLERPESVKDLSQMLDLDIMLNTMLPQDFTEAKEFTTVGLAKMEVSKSMKDEAKTTAQKYWDKHPVAPVAKPKAKKAKPKAAPKPAPKPHWQAKSAAGDTSVLDEAKPSDSKIWTVDFNGCFRITYKGERRKSVSWTLRGRVLAIQMALRGAWLIHEECTGEACPNPELWQDLEDP